MAKVTFTYCPNKRRRRRTTTTTTTSSPPSPSPDWSKLHTDLLESVLKRSSFLDTLRFKSVCRSWRSVAKYYISSSLSKTISTQPPLLMLPTEPQDDDENTTRCFFDMHALKKADAFKIVNGEIRCVGSSHGWLVLFDEKHDFFIFNPFLEVKICLPSCTIYGDPWISKAVLSSDPISGNFGVVVIHSFSSKLAFSMRGDNKWTGLEAANKYFDDVTCYENHVYALAQNGQVEVWDFRGSTPVKKMEIKASFPGKVMEFGESFTDLYSGQCYIVVESPGKVLLVVRCIGNFVGEDGELLYEGDLIGDNEENSHLVCPYLTKKFHVYRLCLDREEWVEVDSLGDHALFLGGNRSVSVSSRDFEGCEKNSIYFTDDYWDRMEEHDMYGGHDMGVFRLKDGSIEPIYPSDELQKIDPPAFWVVPN